MCGYKCDIAVFFFAEDQTSIRQECAKNAFFFACCLDSKSVMRKSELLVVSNSLLSFHIFITLFHSVWKSPKMSHFCTIIQFGMKLFKNLSQKWDILGDFQTLWMSGPFHIWRISVIEVDFQELTNDACFLEQERYLYRTRNALMIIPLRKQRFIYGFFRFSNYWWVQTHITCKYCLKTEKTFKIPNFTTLFKGKIDWQKNRLVCSSATSRWNGPFWHRPDTVCLFTASLNSCLGQLLPSHHTCALG